MATQTGTKNIIAYSPYVHNLGGGEKFFFDFLASVALQQPEATVTVLLPHSVDPTDIHTRLLKRFGLQLPDSISFVPLPAGPKWREYASIVWASRKADLFITISNEYPQFHLSADSICILQFPFLNTSLLSRLRTKIQYPRYRRFVVYSQYVKDRLSQIVPASNVHIVYPLVDASDISPPTTDHPKKPIILSVGRFFKGENSKGQEYLIDFFKKLYDQVDESGLTLVLAGGVTNENMHIVEELKERAQGYPVRFEPNSSRDALMALYRDARIYWHGAGYGIDLLAHPGNVEHFGITIIEAMKSGCVPMAYNVGGPVEILGTIHDGGVLWNNEVELITKTKQLLADDAYFQQMSRKSMQRAQMFNREYFDTQVAMVTHNLA